MSNRNRLARSCGRSERVPGLSSRGSTPHNRPMAKIRHVVTLTTKAGSTTFKFWEESEAKQFLVSATYSEDVTGWSMDMEVDGVLGPPDLTPGHVRWLEWNIQHEKAKHPND